MTRPASARLQTPPLWLAPLPEEPPHGVYLRLAERNGINRISLLQNMTGVKLRHLRMGRHLDHLADMLRCKQDTLGAYSIRPRRRSLWVIAGQAVQRTDFAMADRRVCFMCLAESPYHRFWWDLRFITTCPIHKIRLLNQCSCGTKLSWADASPVKCSTCEEGDVRNLVATLAPRDIVALDQWILGRFGTVDCHQKVSLLDRLPLGWAIETVERIGALVVGGYRPNWQEITDYDEPPEEVRAIGYTTLVGGKLSDALDRAYEGFRTSGSDQPASLRTMYGWFWHWLCYRGGAAFSEELAAALVRHAQEKIQLSRKAFPSLPRDNSTITLSEAAQMCHVRSGTLRKLLAAENLIRTKKRKGSPVMVPRAIAQRIARDLSDSVALKGAAEIIGVGGTSLIKLVRSGRVPAWMRGGNQQKHRYIFRRTEVLAWMKDMIGHASTVVTTPDGMISVTDVPSATNVAITILVDAIASGQIRVERVLEGKPNLRGALVRLDAVRAHRNHVRLENTQDPLHRYTKKRV